MQPLVPIAIWIFAVLVVLFIVVVLVIDMITRVDYIRTKLPGLRWMERKEWHGPLLFVCICLLIANAYEFVIKEMPEASPLRVTFPAPVGPVTVSSTTRAKSRNSASPIELVDFASSQYISVQNNEGEDVFITDLQTKQAGMEFRIWPVNIAIAPRKIEKVSMTTNKETETLSRTADDWNENYRKAATKFGQNCLVFEYFSAHDSSLEMMRNAYQSNNDKLADTEVDGVLHYRTMRSPDQLAVAVKLVATLERFLTCVPAK